MNKIANCCQYLTRKLLNRTQNNYVDMPLDLSLRNINTDQNITHIVNIMLQGKDLTTNQINSIYEKSPYYLIINNTKMKCTVTKKEHIYNEINKSIVAFKCIFEKDVSGANYLTIKQHIEFKTKNFNAMQKYKIGFQIIENNALQKIQYEKTANLIKHQIQGANKSGFNKNNSYIHLKMEIPNSELSYKYLYHDIMINEKVAKILGDSYKTLFYIVNKNNQLCQKSICAYNGETLGTVKSLLSKAQKQLIIHQLFVIVAKLLQANIVHTDIKPENVAFIEDSNEVFLIDLDSCIDNQSKRDLVDLTPSYVAQDDEGKMNSPQDFDIRVKAAIFAVLCTACEVYNNITPQERVTAFNTANNDDYLKTLVEFIPNDQQQIVINFLIEFRKSCNTVILVPDLTKL